MTYKTIVARATIGFMLIQSTAGFAQSAQNFQDALNDARTLGDAAAATITSNINTTTAAQQTPGFTATPPQTGLNQADLKTPASVQYAVCQSSTDPTCQGITTAQSDAQLRGTSPAMISPFDSNVMAAKSISNSPSSVIAGIQGTYSNCGTTSTTTSSTTSDIQSCYWYLLRSLGNACTKKLLTDVTWSCPANGITGPDTSAVYTGPTDNGTTYVCTRTTTTKSCPDDFPTRVYNWSGFLTSCNSTTSPITTTAPVSTVKVDNVGALPKVTQWWSSECAGLESRVPVGLLLPDGDNSMPSTLGQPTGHPNKCARVTSNCSDTEPKTRVFNRYPVAASCWAYTNTFDCVEQQPTSTCNQPRFGSCSLAQSGCVEWDSLDPQYCNTMRNDYSCSTTTQKTEQGVNCNNQIYTDREGNAWPVGSPPGQNFAKVVTGLELVREAGMYMDANNIFAGEDDRCDIRLFGLVNCCNKSGSNAGALFTDLATLGATYADYGKIIGTGKVSAYTYGSLFKGSGSPWLSIGMELLTNDTLYDMIYLASIDFISVEELLAYLVPGPWSIVVLLIIASGILDCPDQAVALSMKRDADLCVDLGTYCSKKIKFINVCVTHTHSYCCFVSKLAKIINTQGKAQLGISMGSASSPNCGGLTLDQIQNIDFAKIDMTEFMSSITCTVGAQTMPCDQVGNIVPTLPSTLPVITPVN